MLSLCPITFLSEEVLSSILLAQINKYMSQFSYNRKKLIVQSHIHRMDIYGLISQIS